jgi:O-antigen ligase
MFFVAISALPLLIILVCRYPVLILWSFPFVHLLEVFSPYLPTDVGNFKILPMDPVYLFMVTYLGFAVLRNPKKVVTLLRENIFLSIFVGVVALYVFIYTPVHGQSAVGEARKIYGFFLFPFLALMVIKTSEDLRAFVQMVILVAAVVEVAALGRTAAQGSIVGSVNSEGALIVVFAAFAILIHRFHRVIVFAPVVDRVLFLLFAALAIGSGHRSVWLALGLGQVLLVLLYRRRPIFMSKFAVVTVAVIVVSGTALVYFPGAGARLAEKFAGIIDPYSDDTASWRIEGWQQQLERLHGARLLFGEGIGGYYSWQLNAGYQITASPHNAYVQMVLKFGLFGLAVYALLALDFFRRAAAFRRKLSAGPAKAYVELGIVNFGAAHAYMIGYGMVPVVLVFFTVGLCAIKLGKNLNEVTAWSPVHARKLRPLRWIPTTPVRRHPATRYQP